MAGPERVFPFRSEALDRLEKVPAAFFSALGWHLSVAARGSYVEAGVSREDSIKQLESLNEVLIVVLEQLRSLPKGAPAYPNDAILDVLAEKAVVGTRSGDLRWAVERALQDIERWESDGSRDVG